MTVGIHCNEAKEGGDEVGILGNGESEAEEKKADEHWETQRVKSNNTRGETSGSTTLT